MSYRDLLNPNQSPAIKLNTYDLTVTNNLRYGHLIPNPAESEFIVDSNPAAGAKYNSIQTAINEAALTLQPQVIIIRVGTYNENITLNENIYLQGVSQSANFVGTSVIINGKITANISGPSGLTNLDLNNTNDNIIESTSGNGMLSIQNCSFSTTTSGNCIFVNSGLNVLIRQSSFYQAALGFYFVDTAASGLIAIFDSIVGALGSPSKIRCGINCQQLVLLRNILASQIEYGSTITVGISFYNFYIINADAPCFTLVNNTQLIAVFDFIIGNPTSGTDFIDGLGSYIKNQITVLGRTTAAGTIIASSLTVF